MLIGDRDKRQYVEPEDHRRGYSIRPAYRPEPGPAEMRINAIWAFAALMVVGVVFGLCVALVR
jgi:hypothetical protein